MKSKKIEELKYFTKDEFETLTKEEMDLQATIGLQSCKTKADVMDILSDIRKHEIKGKEKEFSIGKIMKDVADIHFDSWKCRGCGHINYTLKDIEEKARSDERNKIFDIIKGFKITNGYPKEYAKQIQDKILEISKETHNFPHYWTCKTCEDGWDMIIDFVLEELKKRLDK